MKRKRGHLVQLDEYTWVLRHDDGDRGSVTAGDYARAAWFLARGSWALVFGRGRRGRNGRETRDHQGHGA